MLLISKEEREYLAKNCSFVASEASGIKVLDIEKAKDYMMKNHNNRKESNIKVIEPIHVQANKNLNYGFTCAKDRNTGVHFGIVNGFDTVTNNPRWTRIALNDGLTLNLNHDFDQKVWTVIRMCSKLEGSPNCKEPEYQLYDPVSEAQKELAFDEAVEKAFEKATTLKEKPREAVLFLRHLGENVDQESNLTIVRSKLLKSARTSPYVFLDSWKDSKRPYNEVLSSAVSLEIVDVTSEGLLYNNINLGITKEEAIQYLKSQDDVYKSLQETITQKDGVVKKIQNELPKKQQKTTNNNQNSPV